jgi:hypothetical protein
MAPRNGPKGRLNISELESLPPERQAAALADAFAVGGLAVYGEASRTVDLIEKLAPGQQAAVLAAPEAMSGLRAAGQTGSRLKASEACRRQANLGRKKAEDRRCLQFRGPRKSQGLISGCRLAA